MNVEWSYPDPLPGVSPGTIQPGVAGPFAGLHGNTLIVAGGANFPDSMPWHGGKKKYHDEIYLLQLPAGTAGWNVLKGNDSLPRPVAYGGSASVSEALPRPVAYGASASVSGALPRPVAYGASASVSAGVVCMGGETDNGITDEVYMISVTQVLVCITHLPPLPVPLANAAAASAGSVVYIAGGQTPAGPSGALLSLDTEDPGAGWKKHATMPLPLINSVMAAVTGREIKLWMLGGRTRGENDDSSVIRSEIFTWSPATDTWTLEGDLKEGRRVIMLAAGTGAAIDSRHIALFGGNDGSVFNRVESVLSAIARETDTVRQAALRKEYISLQENHPGFSRQVIVLDTETGKSYVAGEIPGPAQVTTTAVATPWGIVIPSGEIKPGVRTPAVRLAVFN